MADEPPSEIARPFFEQGYEIGLRKGVTKSIFEHLDRCGVDLTEEQRDTIRACTDLDRLEALMDHTCHLAAAHRAFTRELDTWVAEQSAAV
ncbi:hypothetical protein GCM10027570_02630 [Streptomonospora sediminis]